MATFGTTLKHALRVLQGTSLVSEIDAGFEALADDLDAIIAVDDQGTVVPVSTLGAPGKKGRYYFKTDTGQLFRDNGTGWDEIPLAPIGTADLAANAVTAAKIETQQAWQTLTGINGIVIHYFKDTLGNVHLRQELQAVVAPGVPVNTAFATLPAGYRPGATIYGVAMVVAPSGSSTTPSPKAAIALSTAGAMTNFSGDSLLASANYVLVFPPFRAEN